MRSASPTSSGSTRFCGIWGRPISFENNKTDEHGNIVHRECCTARRKLRQAGSPVMKKTSQAAKVHSASCDVDPVEWLPPARSSKSEHSQCGMLDRHSGHSHAVRILDCVRRR